jgi:hypothetical protein
MSTSLAEPGTLAWKQYEMRRRWRTWNGHLRGNVAGYERPRRLKAKNRKINAWQLGNALAGVLNPGLTPEELRTSLERAAEAINDYFYFEGRLDDHYLSRRSG